MAASVAGTSISADTQAAGRGGLSRLRRALASFLTSPESQSPRRGRLLLEQLESRQMMAGDVEMLFSSGLADTSSSSSNESAYVATTSTPEGEAAADLVGFAKALTTAGVKFYGAAWCPACTEQKRLFEDGAQFLPFIEVTNADRTLNEIGEANDIEVFPTWVFPDGTRLTGVQTLSDLSQRSGVAIPQSSSPSFAPIGNQNVAIGSPLHVPVDAYNPGGGPVTITVEVADPSLLDAVVLSGNRSIRMRIAGYGDMVFELFEDRAPRPAGRVIELAESGFYDGIILHRIIDNFVIQGGDPTGTGTSGSPLGNFDDQFHPDLQHNRTGVLSFAKSTDDTNNSQFFITEGPQRMLDYNHSIFGQLVEGEKVREAISEIADESDPGVNGNGRPNIDIVIESMTVFEDTENSVVMLKAKGNQTGTTTVKFTATNADGSTYTEEVTVTVGADSGAGSNSAPYLQDIPAPGSVPNDQPATLQLSSVDVEGDPVQYFASTSTAGVTATVNPTTGLVTVTPSAGFVGAAVVTVGVRPAPGVSGAISDQSDTQRVTFNFVNPQQVVAAPTSVDLAAASDSGASNSDNITRAGSLTFNVAGVQNGAEVLIYAGNVEIGRGTAQGTTAAVTTTNLAALGDGNYQITARQVIGGQTSSASPALSITYDATVPVSVQNFPTAANVGVPLNVNLNHPEEGTGLVYALTSAPQGATINAQTGVISWTPTAAQLGAQSLTLTLTDVAGNVRTETFTVNVAAAPMAGARLEITDLDGNVITQIDPNQEFLLHFYASDLREPLDRLGIFAAFIDVLFDPALVAPVTGTPIEFGEGFGAALGSGSFATGLINELGSVSELMDPMGSGEEESRIATVRMRAIAAGTATFVSEPADVSGNDFLLYNEYDAIPQELVTFGRAELRIGERFTAANDTYTVAKGAAAQNLNVLANDTFATGSTGTLTLTSLGTPSNGGTVSIVNNQVRYQPAANFVGTETFTYVVTDNTGVAKTATVSVTVTDSTAAKPTATNDAYTVTEDAALATFNVLANDTATASGQTISVTAVGTPSQGGTVEIGANGQSIRYRPKANFVGTETVTYTITDTSGGTATATVTFTVTAVNDAPPAADITRDFFRGNTNTVVATLADYGTNVDGNETLTVSLVGNSSAGGTFTVDGTSIRYTPPSANFTGTDKITYRTTDAGGLSSTGTITLNVLASLATTYKLTLNTDGRPAKLNNTFSATLTGTTATGQAVNRTVSLNGTSNVINVPNIAAGTYQLEVPAVPFLTGMEQPQKLNFTAEAAGGELTGSVNIGTLHASYLKLEDFFSSSSRNTLFAVVEPGSDAMLTLGQDRTTLVQSPTVNLNANGSSLTIRGTTTQNAATQATLPMTDARVETRATNGDLRLVKINLAGVTFAAPPASSSTQSTEESSAAAQSTEEAGDAASQAEGESFAAASAASFAPPAGGEGEQQDEAGAPQAAAAASAATDESDSGNRFASDAVHADATDPASRSAMQADSLSEDDDEGLSPDAVDAALSSL